MKDERREGDERPLKQTASLTWRPSHREPFRWLPKHGEPLCVGEWVSQTFVRTFAYLPVYTAIVVTVVLLIQLFGVPYFGG